MGIQCMVGKSWVEGNKKEIQSRTKKFPDSEYNWSVEWRVGANFLHLQ